MMSQDVRRRLKDIKTRLTSGEASPTPTVREFISWVGAQRRGLYIVAELRDELKRAGLVTTPDFEGVYIDTPIAFELRRRQSATVAAPGPDAPPQADTAEVHADDAAALALDDPRHRISRLEAANRAPRSVTPTTSLSAAVTIMLTNDYSQLPVMTSERDVKGAISWQSIARRLATGAQGTEARNFMEEAPVAGHDSSLFAAMREVSVHEFVLVRGADRRISGIVTLSDLSGHFMQLTEPFLLLSEIERSLRGILDRVPAAMLATARDARDSNRKVGCAADLSFGEYVRLLANPDVWDKLGIPLDRATFVKFLDEIRETRNDVMHFDPDGITEDALGQLRNLVKLVDRLREQKSI